MRGQDRGAPGRRLLGRCCQLLGSSCRRRPRPEQRRPREHRVGFRPLGVAAPLGRRRWLVPLTAAAAAIVIVLGLVVVSGDDSQPTADLAGSPATVFPADLLGPGTRWRLVTDPIESGGGAASASLTIRMGDATRAQARVETADVPPRQFLVRSGSRSTRRGRFGSRSWCSTPNAHGSTAMPRLN